MRKHLVFCLVVLLGSVSTARAADAQANVAGPVAKEKAARKACITGAVEAGIDLLADLYVDTKNTTYVFNQARCYQQNHRWTQAVDRFREYLRKAPDLPDQEKAEVYAHIAECEALKAKEASAQPAVTGVSAASTVSTGSNPGAAPVVPETTLAARAAQPKSDGRGLRIGGMIGAGVGVAGIVTGVGLALKVRSLTNELNTKFNAPKEATRASYEKWGYVSYGVGAAALVTGATLYYLGSRAGKSSTLGVALLPAFTPETATLSMQGSF